MIFLVLKMTTNSGASCLVDVLTKVFTLTVGNPDGFKGLRGHDYNATGGLTRWDLLLLITPWADFHRSGTTVNLSDSLKTK